VEKKVSFLLYFACQSTSKPTVDTPIQKPNIILITIDTLRADRLGCYGDPLAQTPNIDRLAQNGVLFRQNQATAPITLPSHASILTGLWPYNHGLRDNAGFSLPQDITTIAEGLQKGGYQTGAFISAYVLHHAWGLNQGFDIYSDPFHPQDIQKVTDFGEAELHSADVINRAIDWYQQQEISTFLWLHLYDPHTPWTPLSNWKGDPYRGEVAKVDYLLGRFFTEVEKKDKGNTFIVLTSDHGEGLWDEGEREHGVFLSPNVTRVPLIIRPPNGMSGKEEPNPREIYTKNLRPNDIDIDLKLDSVPDAPHAARVIEDTVSGVDIAPTIAEFAKIPFEADGISLLPFIEKDGNNNPKNSDEILNRFVYSEALVPYFHYGWHPLKMLINSKERMVSGAYDENINWKTGAKQPIRSEQKDLIQTLSSTILQPGPISSQTQLALEALGYLSDPIQVDIKTAADPRERKDIILALSQVPNLQPTDAIQELHKILERDPNLIVAMVSLSLYYAQIGNTTKALEWSEQVLSIHPNHSTALFNAGQLSRDIKEFDRAMAYAEQMIALNSIDARGYRLACAVSVDKQDPISVITYGIQGIERAPNDPNLHYLVALAYIFTQQPQMGIEHLKQAKEYQSQATDISLWLGIAHERIGEVDVAIQHYEKATKELVSDLRPWVLAAQLLAQNGRCSEARPWLINAGKRGALAMQEFQQALQLCPLEAQ
jgi:arylsulfatase A-like enzyme/tetratricopeptide (TPR) repeat protein